MQNYTTQQIHDALHADDDSRVIDFRHDLLNKNDVKIGTLDGIASAKISYGNLRDISKGTAAYTLDTYLQKEIDFLNDQIQSWFILLMPDGGKVEWSQGIYRLPVSPDIIEGLNISKEISGYDRTIRLRRWRFRRGYVIKKGTEYVAAITKILVMAGITKFDIPFSNSIFAADRSIRVGETALSVINTLLSEINYDSLRADKSGNIRSNPYTAISERAITQKYIANENSIILPSMTSGVDFLDAANIFIMVATNIDSGIELISEYENKDPLSRISTVNQDEVMDYEEIDNIADQASLDSRVRRKASDSSSRYSHINLSTALMPDHEDQDVIYLDLTLPAFQRKLQEQKIYLPDIFKTPLKIHETFWEMNAVFDGEMSHECRRVVQL